VAENVISSPFTVEAHRDIGSRSRLRMKFEVPTKNVGHLGCWLARAWGGGFMEVATLWRNDSRWTIAVCEIGWSLSRSARAAVRFGVADGIIQGQHRRPQAMAPIANSQLPRHARADNGIQPRSFQVAWLD